MCKHESIFVRSRLTSIVSSLTGEAVMEEGKEKPFIPGVKVIGGV